MKLSDSELKRMAEVAAPYFSQYVVRTGQLTDADMQAGLASARRDGATLPKVRSDRSLRLINEYFMGERL